ncbi:MAG TPA: TraB/GumN family protein, partial [Xanthomonadales bacterium]|nr:TraB/GumN family protein [Xanthomonadales bacterium]
CSGNALAEEAITQLETVVVSGIQPGPGLWKLSRDGHVMWVLGTFAPLPKKIEWESLEVEERIAQSSEVVLVPSAEFKVKGGFIGGLFLLPSLLKARNNPDDAPLSAVVSPDDYARWRVLKQKYLPRDKDVEKRRPIFAAGALAEKAIENAGLSFKDRVLPVVKKAAKRRKVPVTEPKVVMKIDQARDKVKRFQKVSLDDLACFRLTLDKLESNVAATRGWGNAWATGDVDALRDLPYTDQLRACADAVLQSEVARDSFGDLRQRMEGAWIAAAEAAIAKNEVSFGVLPMSQIMRPDGVVAQLAAKGYTVEPPKPRKQAAEAE